MISLVKKIRQNNKGFTLSEIIVSIIVSLLILIIISSIFTLDQRVARRGNIKAELTQNARIVIDTMARELRQSNEIVTALPPDDSIPALIAHELQFEDGHTESRIQYIKYYLDNTDLKKQIIVYYFDADCGGPCPPTDPSFYVHWDDTDAWGSPTEITLEEKIMGEFFFNIDFYGQGTITTDFVLQKSNEQVEMQAKIYPRNI